MGNERRLGHLVQLGVVDYAKAWELQRRLAAARAAERIPDTLLLLEHPHTYTLGRSGKPEHLLMDVSEREEKGIQVFDVDRGGDITYHGPGQLVGYPIMRLGRPDGDGRLPAPDYVSYLRRIEAVLIEVLAEWSIGGRVLPGYTGVWVQRGEPLKIAAIGVKVDGKGTSQHGFALNVDPDLRYYAGIVPCGIHDRGVTSMAALLDESIDSNLVRDVVAREFGREFGLRWQRVRIEESCGCF